MREEELVFIVNPVIEQYKVRYILGTNKDAAAIFMELCSRRIYINGFIDDENAGILFFHKPVFAVKDLKSDEEYIVIAFKNTYQGHNFSELCVEICILNPLLRGKKAVIFDAGRLGKKIYKVLQNEGIQAVGLVDGNRSKAGSLLYEKRVFNEVMLDSMNNDTVIIDVGNKNKTSFLNRQNDSPLRLYIEKFPFELNAIQIDQESGCMITPGVIAQLGEYFEHEHITNILLCGNNLELAKKYAEIYKCLDFPPVTFVTERQINAVKNICEMEEIKYKDKYLILLYEEGQEEFIEKLYVKGADKRRCGLAYRWQSPNFNSRNVVLDIHMGYTYEMNSKYPGIFIYGKNHENDFKIAILGESTTDSMLDTKIRSWAEILYSRYCHKNITIYNGGVSGYYSGQEIIKFKRDILKLNPDICIVYDGYNDLMQNVLHKRFNYLEEMVNYAGRQMGYGMTLFRGKFEEREAWAGIPSDGDAVDDWLENIECMYALAKSKNIQFFSFMQPMLFTKKHLDKHSKTILQTMLYHGQNERFMNLARQFRSRAGEIASTHKYIYNLTHIFDEDDVYVDIVHVYERGNEIIAEQIWNVIKDSVR